MERNLHLHRICSFKPALSRINRLSASPDTTISEIYPKELARAMEQLNFRLLRRKLLPKEPLQYPELICQGFQLLKLTLMQNQSTSL